MDGSIKVMVVDDQMIAQTVLKNWLGSLGCDVDIASTGEQALEQLNDEHAIVFMDIGLPDLGDAAGIETTSKIRAKGGHYESLPIIAITAYPSEDVKLKAINAGMTDFLSKPLSTDDLERMLEQYVAVAVKK